jgi:hypothetical protein
VQSYLWVLLQEAFHQVRLVSSKAVQDIVNFVPSGLRGDDLFQKPDKLLASVAWGGLADHFAGLRIQGRIQRQCPVAVILEAMLLRTTGRQRQAAVQSVRVGLRGRPMDDQGGHRRRCAGTGAHDGALCAIRFPRRGGFPGQAALGHALRVRRSSGKIHEIRSNS